jgi:hypothetical protein
MECIVPDDFVWEAMLEPCKSLPAWEAAMAGLPVETHSNCTSSPSCEGPFLVSQRLGYSVGPSKPADTRSSPSCWAKFVDALRRTIGLKPIHLVERWAEAKIRQEDATTDAKLLAAMADYERAKAESQKTLAEADLEHSRAELNRVKATLLQQRGQLAGKRDLEMMQVSDVTKAIGVDPKAEIDRLGG